MKKPARTELLLEEEVEFENKKVTKIMVKRPKGRHMRLLPNSEDAAVEDMYPFFAAVIELEDGTQGNEELIDNLDAADISKIGELVNGFLGKKKASLARRSGTK